MNKLIRAVRDIALIGAVGFALWSQHALNMKLASVCTNTATAQQELLTAAMPDLRSKK
jgi:hypothetical protein